MTIPTPMKEIFDGMTASQLRAWAKKAELAANRKSKSKDFGVQHTDPRLEPLQAMLTALRKELGLNSQEILTLLFKRMRSGYAVVNMSDYRKLMSAQQTNEQELTAQTKPSSESAPSRPTKPVSPTKKTAAKRSSGTASKKKAA